MKNVKVNRACLFHKPKDGYARYAILSLIPMPTDSVLEMVVGESDYWERHGIVLDDEIVNYSRVCDEYLTGVYLTLFQAKLNTWDVQSLTEALFELVEPVCIIDGTSHAWVVS